MLDTELTWGTNNNPNKYMFLSLSTWARAMSLPPPQARSLLSIQRSFKYPTITGIQVSWPFSCSLPFEDTYTWACTALCHKACFSKAHSLFLWEIPEKFVWISPSGLMSVHCLPAQFHVWWYSTLCPVMPSDCYYPNEKMQFLPWHTFGRLGGLANGAVQMKTVISMIIGVTLIITRNCGQYFRHRGNERKKPT